MSLEDFSKIVLIPPNRRLQSSQLPLSIDFLVIVLDQGMPMALCFDFFLVRRSIALVRCTKLMVASGSCVGVLLKFRTSDEVLCVDERVAHKPRVTDHSNELVRWHGVPFLSGDFGVVDLDEKLSMVKYVLGCPRNLPVMLERGLHAAVPSSMAFLSERCRYCAKGTYLLERATFAS